MMATRSKTEKNDSKPILEVRNLHVIAEQSSKTSEILTDISFNLQKG